MPDSVPASALDSPVQQDAAAFKELMSAFPSGVAVVTVTDRTGEPHGFTCSSLCSVGLAPPTLLICVSNRSGTLAIIRDRGRFAVNLLHSQGRHAAEVFSSGAPDRFSSLPWAPTQRLGLPHLVEHAHAIAECEVTKTTVASDHVIVLGEVAAVTYRQEPPLLYGLRQYATWPSGA
ncbi:flavin reductase family protein [Saccharopolyspora elongata]|uniref:Flavin reductase n=1 Tax=Saccharopolyspora elongata TaxID=2530387 RepID=A0A4R4YRA6_9PSEU|nr:flavin reductase family protein [Saccharopolyspora elongata]TDD47731.1 flavin reductase [Saccharopolyspora elongata]